MPGIPGGEIADAVNNYVERIFENFPINPEIRREREERIRGEILHFVRNLGEVREEEIAELIEDQFGEPELIREVYLHSDARGAIGKDRSCVSVLLAVGAVGLLFACGIKIMEFTVFGGSTAASALIVIFAPLLGIFGYAVNVIRSGNRYRIAPFVTLSVAAFIAAGLVQTDLIIVERSPVVRWHLLITVTVPAMEIKRYIFDIDRTGLPQKYTRSRFFTTAHEEAPSALLRVFWLLVAGVAVGNYYVMGRMSA